MALIDCRECGHRISSKANMCLSCGAPTLRGSALGNTVKFAFACLAIYFAYALVSSASSNASDTMAERPGVVQELLDTPANMFDLGLMRMEHRFATWGDKWSDQYWKHATGFSSGTDTNSEYNRKTGRIYVTLSVTESRGTKEQLASGCDKALYSARVIVGKGIPSMFQNRKHRFGNENFKRMREALLDIIDITCVVYGNGSEDIRYRVSESYSKDL